MASAQHSWAARNCHSAPTLAAALLRSPRHLRVFRGRRASGRGEGSPLPAILQVVPKTRSVSRTSASRTTSSSSSSRLPRRCSRAEAGAPNPLHGSASRPLVGGVFLRQGRDVGQQQFWIEEIHTVNVADLPCPVDEKDAQDGPVAGRAGSAVEFRQSLSGASSIRGSGPRKRGRNSVLRQRR